MKIRGIGGSLEESMKRCVEIDANLDAVRAYLLQGDPFRLAETGEIKAQRYCQDPRVGWDTWLVTLNGMAVAYTDGPFDT